MRRRRNFLRCAALFLPLLLFVLFDFDRNDFSVVHRWFHTSNIWLVHCDGYRNICFVGFHCSNVVCFPIFLLFRFSRRRNRSSLWVLRRIREAGTDEVHFVTELWRVLHGWCCFHLLCWWWYCRPSPWFLAWFLVIRLPHRQSVLAGRSRPWSVRRFHFVRLPRFRSGWYQIRQLRIIAWLPLFCERRHLKSLQMGKDECRHAGRMIILPCGFCLPGCFLLNVHYWGRWPVRRSCAPLAWEIFQKLRWRYFSRPRVLPWFRYGRICPCSGGTG